MIAAREMKEDRAAQAPHTRPLVMVEREHDVIEPIRTRELFMARARGQADGAVIVGVGNIIAPARMRFDRMQRRMGAGRAQSILPPIAAGQHKSSGRRLAIAFTFEMGDAVAAERAANDDGACEHPAFIDPSWRWGDDEATDQTCGLDHLSFVPDDPSHACRLVFRSALILTKAVTQNTFVEAGSE